MQFMVSIPKELDESAIIDGCSKYSVFTRIIFPFAETFDHHDDHHPVLLEMGRLHGTIDLFKQAEILHGIDCHQIICRRWI